MSAHLSNEIVERFHGQALDKGDRGVIYDHILACESCRRRVVDSQTEAVAFRAVTKHLLPRDGEEPYHLDAEMVEACVDDKLDAMDRSIVKLHLEDCSECSDEVTDLRESLATMRSASRDQAENPATVRNRVHAVRRLPAFSIPMRIAAMVALVGFVAIALVVAWKLTSSRPEQSPDDRRDLTVGSQPTPVSSPQTSNPQITPSPMLGVNPPKPAENTPRKTPSEPRQDTLVALNDGPNQITLDNAGNLKGMESFPVPSRLAVQEALSGETLERPDVLDEVASTGISARAPTGSDERIRIVYPANIVIAQDKPALEWVPSKTAHAYRVEIGDAQFHQVAKSEDLPATTGAWKAPTPLKRGIVYTWLIRALNPQGETQSTAQGKFKVLAEDRLKELEQLKKSRSHLALGVFYAPEGMINEAEHEFQFLSKTNPRSPVLRKLLK